MNCESADIIVKMMNVERQRTLAGCMQLHFLSIFVSGMTLAHRCMMKKI